jgi:polygalacturonase
MESFSRRAWLERISLPAAGAAIVPAFHSPRRDAPPAASGVYNVRHFGAKGDGAALDTAAVQAAIDACARDGGVVVVPAGDFVIGTVELKSRVTLHLAERGRLLGSGRIEHYHAGHGVPPGNGNIVLLSAANAEHVAIEGPGTIDGNGAKFFTGRGDNTGPGQNSAQGYSERPHLIVFYRCRDVLIRDVFLTASAYHCTRILNCERVNLDGVRIYNRVNKNNDGFHINSSRYVHVSNCDVACQDDACALFGSNTFVTVTNSTFSTRWSVFRFGGGDPENVTVSNCVIYETYGCPIKMRFDGATHAQNLSFSNLIMKDVTGPITVGFDVKSRRATQPDAPPPFVRNLRFSGIRATVVSNVRQHADLPFASNPFPGELRQCIVLNGTGGSTIEQVTLDDVHVTYEGGGTAEEAKAEVPQVAGEYFQIGTPPAYGLYARNVRALTVNNVRLETSSPDARPAIVFDGVTDAAVSGLSAQGSTAPAPVMRCLNTRDVLITAPRALTPSATFLQVEGAASGGIVLDGGDVSKTRDPVSAINGAPPDAVRHRA